MHSVKIAQVGFGSLGKEIFKVLYQNKNFKIVEVIDVNEKLINKDPGNIILKRKTGIKIKKNIEEIKSKPNIVIHATHSNLKTVKNQLAKIANKNIPIISTCEQLVYPINENKKLAKELDEIAIKNKISILAIGVNPGFIMDYFVLILSTLCTKISKIKVTRIVNIARRRKALQKKMFVGFSMREFLQTKGQKGHVGLEESARFVCDGFGFKPTITQTVKPIIAKTNLKSNSVFVKKGSLAGIKNMLIAKLKQKEFLKLELSMFVGAKEHDLIDILGSPPVKIKTNGICGDIATVGLLINYIPLVLHLKPGLHLINEFCIPKIKN